MAQVTEVVVKVSKRDQQIAYQVEKKTAATSLNLGGLRKSTFYCTLSRK